MFGNDHKYRQLHNLLNEARVLAGIGKLRNRDSRVMADRRMGKDETRRELAARIRQVFPSNVEELCPGFDVAKFLKATKAWKETESLKREAFVRMLEEILPRLCGWCGCESSAPHIDLEAYPDPLEVSVVKEGAVLNAEGLSDNEEMRPNLRNPERIVPALLSPSGPTRERTMPSDESQPTTRSGLLREKANIERRREERNRLSLGKLFASNAAEELGRFIQDKNAPWRAAEDQADQERLQEIDAALAELERREGQGDEPPQAGRKKQQYRSGKRKRAAVLKLLKKGETLDPLPTVKADPDLWGADVEAAKKELSRAVGELREIDGHDISKAPYKLTPKTPETKKRARKA